MSGRGIFQESWWWDALAPGQWSEVTLSRGGHNAAGLPYMYRRGALGMTWLSAPPLTRWAGPWIEGTDAKTARRLTREKELLTELIAALPRHDHFQQALCPEMDYWLPFHWAGFELQARVTYRLAPSRSPQQLWEGLDERIRRAVRKARKSLTVVEDGDPAHLIDAVRATYARQNRTPPAPEARIAALVSAALERRVGTALSARDGDGRAHAAAFLVCDRTHMYYVIGGGDAQLRHSGAPSLLLLRALELAGERGLEFDFAGSMVESIEHFFRAFGARPVCYVRATRTSRRYRLLRGLRSLGGSGR